MLATRLDWFQGIKGVSTLRGNRTTSFQAAMSKLTDGTETSVSPVPVRRTWAAVTASGTRPVAAGGAHVAPPTNPSSRGVGRSVAQETTSRTAPTPQATSVAGVSVGLMLHPRAVYFNNFQRYVSTNLRQAQLLVDEAGARIEELKAIPTSETRRLQWLLDAQKIETHKRRRALASTPRWSFAGGLKPTAAKIEQFVSKCTSDPDDIGEKDDRPLVYVPNPPRHGKSLLLDNLFWDEAASRVCVLSATYNATKRCCSADRGETAKGALCALLLRLLDDLIFKRTNWDESWEDSPLAAADDPVKVFRDMIGLDEPSVPNLLFAIDEVSKLVDDPSCIWAQKVSEKKSFWKDLYSLTRASPQRWVRVVMTGFTDTPNDDIANSDVSCKTFPLSMISGPEKELLAAELVWAYAVENQPFPGLLWAVFKSTPGLIGLWAHAIDLHSHTHECYCGITTHDHGVMANVGSTPSMTDFIKLKALIPWAAVLENKATENWPFILEFMKEEDLLIPNHDTIRNARNADLATMLEDTSIPRGTITTQKHALSPFAVAVTVMCLRGRAVSKGQEAFDLLNGALSACETHSAGCAEQDVSWRRTLWNHLKLPVNAATLRSSTILSAGPHLSRPLPEPSNVMIDALGHKVQRQDMGVPYENFVLYSVALRLECLRLAAAPPGDGGVRASSMLPNATGFLARSQLIAGSHLAARHPAELAIAVALPTANINVFLARLCTQTAALLLPSAVNTILDAPVPQHVSRALSFQQSSTVPLLDVGSVTFRFNSVAVAVATDCPATFPCVVLDHPLLTDPTKRFGRRVRQELVAKMTDAYTTKTQFDSVAFVAWARSITTSHVDLTHAVELMVESVTKTAALIARAVHTKQTILFKPTNMSNPLCDVIAAVPCDAVNSVVLLWLEIRDRTSAEFSDQIQKAIQAELLLAPVVEALATNSRVTVVGTLYVPVARAEFVVDP